MPKWTDFPDSELTAIEREAGVCMPTAAYEASMLAAFDRVARLEASTASLAAWGGDTSEEYDRKFGFRE